MSNAPLTVEIVSGSPHRNGAAESVCEQLSTRLEARGIQVNMSFLSSDDVVGCNNCAACQKTGKCVMGGDFVDNVLQRMVAADVVALVAPVYFAGPSSSLKALLDRCQMFWARKYVLKRAVPAKRPIHLVVLGDGGDPFGTQALETVCTSALNCANLRIGERVRRFIGTKPGEGELSKLADEVIASVSMFNIPDEKQQAGDQ